MILLTLLLGCQKEDICDRIETDTADSVAIAEPETPPEPEEPAEDFSMWENAALEILSPAAGLVIELDAPQIFEAAVLDSDGEPMEWDDITWTTDVSEEWTFDGASFEDNTLPAGQHTFRAETILPNGDRLVYALGGIKVQHPFAGTYSGTTTINATFPVGGGNTTTVSCAGAATLTVNLEGTAATGSSACILNLLGTDQETYYNFEVEISETTLGGLAIADLGITQRDFPLTGEIDEETMTATWADTVYGFIEVDGAFDLQRVSY
ncbi:MAG: hypothetical protein VX278_01870 [Myxococcota bacterium]|nr:hypothetical protein [Myxococcota bacterium]